MPRPRKPAGPFRYFNFSPVVIRLVVMMNVRFSRFLRNVKTCRLCADRHLPRDGAALVEQVRSTVCRLHSPSAGEPHARFRNWQWHLNDLKVKLNGELV